jgi:hypothetical protein
MKIRLELTGTAALLMHNIQLANPLNSYARAMKVISSKRKKTDEDYEELARLEYLGGLYISEQLGPYIPGANIEKCLIEGGRVTKQGKQIERGLFVVDNEIPVLYRGPRDALGLLADESFRDVAAVKVGQARVMRTRPMFRDWSVEVDCEVDGGLLNVETLQSIATDAGNMVGIGDHRPRYGRFQCAIQKL